VLNDKIYKDAYQHLSKIVPQAELEMKLGLVDEIEQLKKERNAIILGHNYMEPVLFYTIPDIKGDSLELARKAAETDKDVIVFCGVKFMAETAKILSPQKTVLLPAEKAGCSLAESITAEDVRNLKKKFPGVPVITYINTYADVKAECDVCCTSGNAAAVVESFKGDTVIFLPDEFLAGNVARETGKHIIFPKNGVNFTEKDLDLDYQMIGWKGCCEVHEQFSVEDIENARKQFNDVVILAHPECKPEVAGAADFSGSTSAMIKYVQDSKASHYMLLTECAMGDNIAAANPDKEMLRICNIRCPHMNEITMEDTLASLKYNRYEITVPEEIRLRALKSVQRMLEIG
jgi:quinolinate synthase